PDNPSLSLWRVKVRRLGELMREAGVPVLPGFARVSPLTAQSPAPERPSYGGAGVYVSDADDPRPAAAALGAAGPPVNRDVVNQLEGVARLSRNYFLLLGGVVSVLTLMSFWNISVMQELRLVPKAHEVGLLKALGMSEGRLRAAYLTEAVLIWWVA